MKYIQHFSKKLKIDNFGQNVVNPDVYHKSVLKLHTMDPKYESVKDDPYFQKNRFFQKEFLINLQRYPDDNEVLIDVDKFQLMPYLKSILKQKFRDLDEQDQFPYRFLSILIFFIIQQTMLSLYLWHYDDYYKDFKVATEPEHYDYSKFEDQLKYAILLFQKSL